ncbi:DUF887-domain-containing protein [Lophium mytilinum]|uniref:DUF887-domain-containing protein n=1 Tax=Lophium mytilinum TaxID=390894 RepID=A0A6A6R6R1_9PEZI|nr:DUF887-domain-containing protein [Lophium mytilinum]
MRDPFPVPPWLSAAVQPLTKALHLNTLHLHIHEVILIYLFYTLINSTVSPAVSSRLLGAKYDAWPRRTQLGWNMHVTAFLNSLVLSGAALYVIFFDLDRAHETWEDRIWGYTGLGGLVQAVGAGYFVWDVQVCVANFNVLGVVDLLHALVAAGISVMGYYPFGLYYGMHYALIELSTPFANIHWFLNKLGQAGSRVQVINGMLLITTFFTCRLVWGSYLTFVFFRDVWTALHAEQSHQTTYVLDAKVQSLDLEHRAPWWLACLFMVTNSVVMGLSTFWFVKMVDTVRRHSSGEREGVKTVKVKVKAL